MLCIACFFRVAQVATELRTYPQPRVEDDHAALRANGAGLRQRLRQRLWQLIALGVVCRCVVGAQIVESELVRAWNQNGRVLNGERREHEDHGEHQRVGAGVVRLGDEYGVLVGVVPARPQTTGGVLSTAMIMSRG